MKKKQNKDTQAKKDKFFKDLTNFMQIGITMAASVLIGVLLGKYLDNLLGTSPWLLLVFSLFGAGAAIKSLFDSA